ncbi:hypothetical protein C8F04DRAFT_1188031 [Mycena alexandri]|uniref:Transposase n=1 Tax=Mycena alexandri TaxID=1745969 RepID=A0AAD6SKF4_9AGAR|nr:hypothetical protein C8F04DRAFT_1188031 [Mycena alexandri]
MEWRKAIARRASFDPVTILAILVALQPSGARSKFESDWKKNATDLTVTVTRQKIGNATGGPRSAVARALFDLIIEFGPSGTSGGIAEHIKQLHLLEYHEHQFEYLHAYHTLNMSSGSLGFALTSIEPFSAPSAPAGYNDTSITDDMVREVYMSFAERTRSKESPEYLRNLSPRVCLGADNTFKVAGKATVVDVSKTRTKLMKGGIASIINNSNEIISWHLIYQPQYQRFCQSASPVEMGEMLMGIRRRCVELGISFPLMITVNNCCQVAKDILKAFPDIQICLDVYHFMMQYLAAVLNGTNNPHRRELAADIRNAVLKNSASKGVLAQYWDQEEQESKMIAVYDKYSVKDGVWSAAAHAVHTAQLKHLRKGCLSRRDQTVASDGSRIEGSHKGWNSIQRASASGLEHQTALSHDFVHRRNIRVVFGKTANTSNLDDFLRTTFGSHHSRLVSHSASVWNEIVHTEATRRKASASNEFLRPVLKNVASGETFGLVKSQHNDTFGGLLTIKDETLDDDDQLFNQALENLSNPEEILGDLNINPALLLQPLPSSIAESSTGPDLPQRHPGNARSQIPPSISELPPDGVDVEVSPAKRLRIGVEGASSSADRNVGKTVHSFFHMNKTASTKPQPAVTGLTNLLPLPTPADSTMSATALGRPDGMSIWK